MLAKRVFQVVEIKPWFELVFAAGLNEFEYRNVYDPLDWRYCVMGVTLRKIP